MTSSDIHNWISPGLFVMHNYGAKFQEHCFDIVYSGILPFLVANNMTSSRI